MTVWKLFTNLCLVRLFIEVDLVGRVGIGREIQELGMGEILERIDGRPLGGETIVGQIQQVEGGDLKMVAGWDCEPAKASKYIVGGRERVEEHLRREDSVAKSVRIVMVDV